MELVDVSWVLSVLASELLVMSCSVVAEKAVVNGERVDPVLSGLLVGAVIVLRAAEMVKEGVLGDSIVVVESPTREKGLGAELAAAVAD